MRELNQIRDAVLSALRAEALTALEAYPDQWAKRYDCPVAAVAVETAESRTVGFCNYLGEVSDPETGQVRELYGKQLDAVIAVDIRGPGRRTAREAARRRRRYCWAACPPASIRGN